MRNRSESEEIEEIRTVPLYPYLLQGEPPNQPPHDVSKTPVSILYKSIAGRYRPVRVADGPITARYRFIKNASWDYPSGLY